MARSIDQIQRDYADDVRRAEKWDESDPERGNALRKAEADRADAFRELAESEGVARRTVELENQKAALKAKYPYADVNAIRGETVEAMEDAAKASHAHTEAAVKAQQEADRAARRADTRAAWTGGAGTRVGLPGGEIQQPTSVAKEELEGAWHRTADIIDNAKRPGHLRHFRDDNTQAVPSAGDPEMAAWKDYELMHPNSGLTFNAFVARNAGRASFVEQPSGVGGDEDKKG